MDVTIEILVFIVIEAIIAFITTMTNILVCYVILSTPAFRKKPMYLFVISLAAADLLVGAIVIPFGILSMLGIPMNNPKLCMVMVVIATIPSQISIFSLVAISFERYFAISHPYKHLISLTVKKSLLIIVTTWVGSCLIGLLPIAWNDIDWMYSSTNVSMAMALHTQKKVPTDHNENMFKLHHNRSFECMFGKVLNQDYLFLKFVMFGIIPLLICVISYTMIFLKVKNSLKLLYSPKNKTKRLFKRLSIMIASKRDGKSQQKKLNRVRSEKKNDNNNKAYLKQLKIDCGTMKKNGNVKQFEFIQDRTKKLHLPVCQIENIKSETEFVSLSKNSKSEVHGNSKVDSISVVDCTSNSTKKPKCEIQRFKSTTSEILQSISNQGKHKRKRPRSDASLDTLEQRSPLQTTNEEVLARYARRKKEIHVASVLGLIVMGFVLCWMPIHILNAIQRFSNEATQLPSWAFSTAVTLSHANSMINFFLYACRLHAFRTELRQKILLFFKKWSYFNFSRSQKN